MQNIPTRFPYHLFLWSYKLCLSLRETNTSHGRTHSGHSVDPLFGHFAHHAGLHQPVPLLRTGDPQHIRGVPQNAQPRSAPSDQKSEKETVPHPKHANTRHLQPVSLRDMHFLHLRRVADGGRLHLRCGPDLADRFARHLDPGDSDLGTSTGDTPRRYGKRKKRVNLRNINP